MVINPVTEMGDFGYRETMTTTAVAVIMLYTQAVFAWPIGQVRMTN
jgi:hypothetical protein